MSAAKMTGYALTAVGYGNRDAVWLLLCVAMRANKGSIWRAGMLEHISYELTDAILDGRKTVRLGVHMQQRRDVADYTGERTAIGHLCHGQEPTRLFPRRDMRIEVNT